MADIRLSEDSKLFSAIAYVLGTLIAIIIFLLKKEDNYVRFHAAQAILLDISIMVVSFALMAVMFVLMIAAGLATMGVGFFLGFWVLWIVLIIYGLALFVARLYMAFMAYNGKRFELPFIGKHANNIAAG